MRARGVVLRWHGGLCNAIWCGVEGPRQQGNRPLPHVGAAALCRRVRVREKGARGGLGLGMDMGISGGPGREGSARAGRGAGRVRGQTAAIVHAQPAGADE